MYDKWLKWAAIVSLIVALSLPLFSVVAPYIAFRLSLRQLPMDISNHHVQDSLASVWHCTLVSVCLLPLVAQVPFVCAPGDISTDRDDISTLQRFIVSQRTFCDQLVRFAPPPHVMAGVAAIKDGANLAVRFDGTIMLLEDGVPELLGIGNVRLLVAISEAARSSFEAAYDLLAHIELSLSRYGTSLRPCGSMTHVVVAYHLHSRPSCPRSLSRSTSTSPGASYMARPLRTMVLQSRLWRS